MNQGLKVLIRLLKSYKKYIELKKRSLNNNRKRKEGIYRNS
jgi:hypothetical protein